MSKTEEVVEYLYDFVSFVYPYPWIDIGKRAKVLLETDNFILQNDLIIEENYEAGGKYTIEIYKDNRLLASCGYDIGDFYRCLEKNLNQIFIIFVDVLGYYYEEEKTATAEKIVEELVDHIRDICAKKLVGKIKMIIRLSL